MEIFNELHEIGESATLKTQVISWGIGVGVIVIAYQLGKRSGKNQEK